MQVWVVNFLLPNGYTHNLQFAFTSVYKTKETLLASLEFMGFEMDKVHFEKGFGKEDGEDCYLRYYPIEDDRMVVGELQWIRE